jgi:hypothetical protein
MKIRIAAILLTVVMLLGILPMSVGATMPTLQSYIDSTQNSWPHKDIIISLPGNTVVSEATTIPSNIKIYVGPGAKLFVDAALTVYGELCGTETNIIIRSGGSVSYKTAPSYPHYDYYCNVCKTNSKYWCNACSQYHCCYCAPQHPYHPPVCTHNHTQQLYCTKCKTYYCAVCEGGYHVSGMCIYPGDINNCLCPSHSVSLLYCSICKVYYCHACINGYHVQSTADPTKCVISPKSSTYCPTHCTAKLYCNICNKYYCPTCAGGYHVQSAYNPAVCVILPSNPTYPYPYPTYPYPYPYDYPYLYPYYYNYIYIPGYGYIPSNMTCSAPTANIASGTPVEEGTAVTLTTATPGATIYYTTNGNAPSIYTTRYTEPIVITKDMTIRAVAVYPGMFNSPVSQFSYKIKVPASNKIFNDLNGFPGLAASLDKLLLKKVIAPSSSFYPEGNVSWDDVSEWFEKLGVKVSAAKIDPDTDFADADELTYEEMIFACYKIMRAGKLIMIPRKSGSETIKKLKYYNEITDAAKYKSAYASFIENGVLYGLDFRPQDSANRAYLATAVAWACNKAD